MMEDVVSRLKTFMENEARSCSMDYGGITPIYVYRMWGGRFSIEEIEKGLMEIRKHGDNCCAMDLRIYGNKDY